jgi:glycosyltransferase involved in cell wall biosynthesis
MRVLCSISTKGRYDTTLPLAIQSVIMQTRKVDKLVIYDDNDPPRDMREVQLYQYLYDIMNFRGITWEWVWAQRKGQVWNHQMANTSGYDFVWRIDDDCIAEPHVLETLLSYVDDSVGAVGGAILTPPFPPLSGVTGLIENISSEPSIQWDYIRELKEVDHLHCSFLYRAGIVDYNLGLSRAAFREETLFTYGLKQRGYRILVVPEANTWHLRNKEGGVRTEGKEMFDNDDRIFRNILELKDSTVVVLDCGMGDHVVFNKVLPEIHNPVIFSCYPEIVPGRSIAEAKTLFGSIDGYNIYRKMDEWGWKSSLEDAFRKMYVGDQR